VKDAFGVDREDISKGFKLPGFLRRGSKKPVTSAALMRRRGGPSPRKSGTAPARPGPAGTPGYGAASPQAAPTAASPTAAPPASPTAAPVSTSPQKKSPFKNPWVIGGAGAAAGLTGGYAAGRNR
jgi:hypothetical protein